MAGQIQVRVDEGKKKEVVKMHFSLPDSVARELREVSEKTGEPQSRIVTAALQLFFAEVRGEQAPPEAELVLKKLRVILAG